MYYWVGLLVGSLYLVASVLAVVLFLTQRQGVRLAFRLAAACGVASNLFLVALGVRSGRFPVTTVFEAMSFLALLLAVVSLAFELRGTRKSFGGFAFPLVFLFQLLSVLFSRTPALGASIVRLPLFSFHTISTLLGYSCFIYAMVLGLLYLYVFHGIRAKRFRVLGHQLPPMEILDQTNVVTQVAGLIFLGLGIASGSGLSLLVWERLPWTDIKILLSAALWIFFLVSILLRGLLRWGGRRMSFMPIVGFALIMAILAFETFGRSTLHRF